jgi:hypothetical protein
MVGHARRRYEILYNSGGAAPPTTNNFPGATPGEIKGTGSSMTSPWELLGNGRLLLPRVTRSQRDALTTPEAGLLVRTSDGIRVSAFGADAYPEPLSLIGRTLQREFWNYEEFIATPVDTADTTMSNWVRAANTNAGATPPSLVAINDEANHPGIWELQTGNGTTARFAVRWPSTRGIFLGNGLVRFGFLLRIPTLSNGTDRFTISVGLTDDTTLGGGNEVNAVNFTYLDNVNSGKWFARTAAASPRSSADAGITVVAGTWYLLEAVVNAAGNSVAFYVGGVLKATIVTNIPTARVIPYAAILKALGTTSRNFDVDMAYVYGETSADRG